MNRIREYRQKKGLTQIDLSKALNISQAALSGYETGRYEPDMRTMKRLAEFFNVSLDCLFRDDIKQYEETKESDIWELLEQVRRDPERHYLFSLAKDADIEQVRQAVAIIDALKQTRG